MLLIGFQERTLYSFLLASLLGGLAGSGDILQVECLSRVKGESDAAHLRQLVDLIKGSYGGVCGVFLAFIVRFLVDC